MKNIRKTTRHLVICVCLAAITVPAQAQILGRGFGGALGGAALGSLVGGRDGARTGAIIGGAVGVIRGVSERARRQAEAEARQRQEAERQRIAQEQQQAEIARLQAQQAAAAAATSTSAGGGVAQDSATGGDFMLIIEIQKSLIRLGYDPGVVDGQLSPSTVNAIKGYQAAKGLLEDGRPSPQLLTHMVRNGG